MEIRNDNWTMNGLRIERVAACARVRPDFDLFGATLAVHLHSAPQAEVCKQ